MMKVTEQAKIPKDVRYLLYGMASVAPQVSLIFTNALQMSLIKGAVHAVSRVGEFTHAADVLSWRPPESVGWFNEHVHDLRASHDHR